MSKIKVGVLALFLAISLSACGKGSNKNVSIPGVTGPNVNFVDNKLTMSIVLNSVTLDVGARIPVPKMPNSYLEVGPDLQSSGLLINIGVDANDLKALAGTAINTLDPTLLPGGRPLPGIASGQLPGMAIEVPKWDHIVFYAGVDLFGVFVPVVLPFENYMGTFRFFDGAGDQVGNLSIVGEDISKKNSGILLLVNLKGKVGQLIGM